MIIADSSIWIDYFNGNENFKTNLLDQKLFDVDVIMLDIIYLEILQGFGRQRDFEQAKEMLDYLPNHRTLVKEVRDLAIYNYRYLRKKGITPRKSIDNIIASYCIRYDIELLENDKDYLPYQQFLGLRCLNKL